MLKFLEDHLLLKKFYKQKIYPKKSIAEIVKKLFTESNLFSKEVIWNQYDHMITRNVLSEMGGNASIIKTNHKYQAIATTTDCNIYYCEIDPFLFRGYSSYIRKL